MVIAFMSASMTAASVPRCPGPVIFPARIGSFLAIEASTVRCPPGPSRASRVVKAPAGTEGAGHSTSARTSGVNGVPNRNGAAATITVLVSRPVGGGGRTSIGGNASPWLGELRPTADTVR